MEDRFLEYSRSRKQEQKFLGGDKGIGGDYADGNMVGGEGVGKMEGKAAKRI